MPQNRNTPQDDDFDDALNDDLYSLEDPDEDDLQPRDGDDFLDDLDVVLSDDRL